MSYILNHQPLSENDTKVFVNGEAVEFSLTKDGVTLSSIPNFIPVKRFSGKIWRFFGGLLHNKGIYNKGCKSEVVIFYSYD